MNGPVDDAVADKSGAGAVRARRSALPRWGQLVPWFVIGSLAMVTLRLGADIRTIARAGGPVVATVVASLVVIAGLTLALILALRLA